MKISAVVSWSVTVEVDVPFTNSIMDKQPFGTEASDRESRVAENFIREKAIKEVDLRLMRIVSAVELPPENS